MTLTKKQRLRIRLQSVTVILEILKMCNEFPFVIYRDFAKSVDLDFY